MDSVKIERNGVEAEVIERYLPDFLADGWTKVAADVKEKIALSESKEEVEAIVKENFNVDIDKRGSLETIKEKALSLTGE